MIPSKSKERYDKNYVEFLTYLAEKEIPVQKISANVVFTFFREVSEYYAPTSLSTVYSTLKKELFVKNNIEIDNFSVFNYIKTLNNNYLPSQASTFEEEDLMKLF